MARFHYLYGVAIDRVGNLFVVDSGNKTIRKVTPDGVVSTFAGAARQAGSIDGAGAIARFNGPSAIAIDGSDNVYVADAGNNSIRKITSTGVVTTLATSTSFSSWPSGLTVDSKGNVFVVDKSDNAIRIVSPQGVVTTLTVVDVQGMATSVNYSGGIAIDGTGTLYVTDSDNSIRKITLAANDPATGVVTIMKTTDSTGGAVSAVNPNRFAIDKEGNLYVAEADSTVLKITAAGVLTTLAGGWEITGLAVDGSGNVYTTDKYTNDIGKIAPSGAYSTLAGGGATQAGWADGKGMAATFFNPSGIATDQTGNVYVVDTGNSIVRKVTSEGVVSTLAGTRGNAVFANAKGASAGFVNPYGVATDSVGNVYVADAGSNTIRKITPDGSVSTYAGMAYQTGAINGNATTEATFNSPVGVALDRAGNMYVADAGNNAIRLITPGGNVSTYAGSLTGQSGFDDGNGAAARFNSPSGIATDAAGNVFVSDTGNSTIRMISPSGQVITIAGVHGQIGSADGTMQKADSRFNFPNGLATDSVGNVYVADSGNSTIRKIARDGTTVRVSTIVGSAGSAGFAPGSLPGILNYPIGVAVSGATLYITMRNGVAVVQNLN